MIPHPRIAVLDESGDVGALAEQTARQLGGQCWVAHDYVGLGRILDEVPNLDILVAAIDTLDLGHLERLTLVHEEMPAVRLVLMPRLGVTHLLGTRTVDATELAVLLARSGCNDILPHPAEPEVFVHALKRAEMSATMLHRWAKRVTEDRPASLGKVHAVSSARGGSGRTFFAISLAGDLASLPDASTCLIDLDLPIGQAAAALGLRPPFTIVDALSAGDDLENQLVGFCERHPSGVSVLAAPAPPDDASRLTLDDLVRVVHAARRVFTHVVVDIPPATSRLAFAVLREATDVWCLATPNIASLRTLTSLMPTLERLDLSPADVRVVLNMVGTTMDVRMEEIDSILPYGLTAALPWSRKFGQSSSVGRTVFDVEPHGELATRLVSLFSAYIGGADAPPAEVAPKRRTGGRGLFGRRR
jgi:pilus assembly protein CpaE